MRNKKAHTSPRRGAIVEAFDRRSQLIHTVTACENTSLVGLLHLIAITTVIIQVFRHNGFPVFCMFSFGMINWFRRQVEETVLSRLAKVELKR